MTTFLLAEFATARAVTEAARIAADAGKPARDALLPVPVDGIVTYLEPAPSHAPVGWVMAVAGATGAGLGYFMQWYSAVIDYPILSGGRPLNSWPVFLLVPYEMAILFAGICGMLGWLFLSGLPRLHHPLFNTASAERATRDRYYLVFSGDEVTERWITLHLKPASIEVVPE